MRSKCCFPYYILLAASSSLRSDTQASEAATEVRDGQIDHVISISANESLIGCVLSLPLCDSLIGWIFRSKKSRFLLDYECSGSSKCSWLIDNVTSVMLCLLFTAVHCGISLRILEWPWHSRSHHFRFLPACFLTFYTAELVCCSERCASDYGTTMLPACTALLWRHTFEVKTTFLGCTHRMC